MNVEFSADLRMAMCGPGQGPEGSCETGPRLRDLMEVMAPAHRNRRCVSLRRPAESSSISAVAIQGVLPGLNNLVPPSPARRKPTKRATVTFEGGLNAPFHRWFRLTPSFSPLLVEKWLDRFCPNSGSHVLDPFAGAATTCIVAKLKGMDTTGIEINPFLAFVGRTSLDWSLAGDEVLEASRVVCEAATELLSSGPRDPLAFLQAIGDTLPPLHNISRWWRDDVLRDLLALRYCITKFGGNAQDHLRLALAEIVYSTANITLGRLQLAFVDRSDQSIEVLDPFAAIAARIAEDLRRHIPSQPGISRVYNADSTELKDIPDATIDALITSPPYPNRYSYVWNTRPHLYLLEFITTAKEAGDLDCRTIGGTWGKATSNLQRDTLAPSSNVALVMGDQLERLYEKSLLMGNYVTKYFNDLDKHLAALKPKLKSGAPVGYVVGNSETKGIMIETHDLLASLLDVHGLTDVQQEHLRGRNSGVGLVEVTVTAFAP